MESLLIRSVLVATDLSPYSDDVVRSAAALASRSGGELHVLSVFSPPAAGFGDNDIAAPVVEEAERALATQMRRVLPDGTAPASQVAVFGSAAKVIVERAEQVGAGVIALGAHRGGNVEASFLGTTADRVIRTAEVPCLVIRGSLPSPVGRIGVPVDFSNLSRRALATAIAWSRQVGPREDGEEGSPGGVCVLHVTSPSAAGGTESGDPTPALEAEVRAAVESVEGDPPRIDQQILRESGPEEAIVRWASLEGVDLLVMGTKGRSKHGRAKIGSVASAVTRRSPCPVLLVPPPRSGT